MALLACVCPHFLAVPGVVHNRRVGVPGVDLRVYGGSHCRLGWFEHLPLSAGEGRPLGREVGA